MIDLQNICFAYDDNIILNNFCCKIEKGEFALITGDNGCGKSTLMHILNGLIFPHSGKYCFDGKEITEKTMKSKDFASAFHSKIGYIFQNTDAQLFSTDVKSEIEFGAIQACLSASDTEIRIKSLVKMFSLNNLLKRAPYTLSAGEKKRVALACVLVTNPKVLILDEPFSGLDKSNREILFDLLKQLKQTGKTIICVSHTDELHSLADNVIEL